MTDFHSHVTEAVRDVKTTPSSYERHGIDIPNINYISQLQIAEFGKISIDHEATEFRRHDRSCQRRLRMTESFSDFATVSRDPSASRCRLSAAAIVRRPNASGPCHQVAGTGRRNADVAAANSAVEPGSCVCCYRLAGTRP